MSLQRALELADEAQGRAYPKPTVGAVVVAGDEIVGEGATEARGHRTTRRDRRARGRRRAGPRRDALRDHGALRASRHNASVRRRRARRRDRPRRRRLARPESRGWGRPGAAARPQGVAVELADSVEARRQNEAWRTWVAEGRPFVTYKAAVTLDGRVTVPGSRWVSGVEARRLVHELRAASDAVAVGMGTVRLENPRLDARDVDATRQPRRLAFGTRAAARGLRARAAIRAARGGAPRACVRGRPVAPARRRADARRRLPPRRSRRQAPALRRADALRLRAGSRRPPRRVAHARPAHEQAGRRRRSPRGLSPRAVTSSHVHRARARGGESGVVRGRQARGRVRNRGRAGRLRGDRRRLPDGRRQCRGQARLRRRAGDARRVPSVFAGRVNVEPALRAGDPLGGHQVQGHVDGVGRVTSVEPAGLGRRIRIELPAELLRYCAEKGSISVDGVSLTVAALDEPGSRWR